MTAQPTFMLFRGRQPDQYLFQYNGTYFWNQKGFEEGTIFYNGKVYDSVLLAVDAFHQEVQVKPGIQFSPIVVSRDEVAWLEAGGTRWVNLQYLGYSDAPTGFFELVRDGDTPLLKQVGKVFRSSAYGANGHGIGYDDPDYKEDVPNYFAYFESFYTVEDGKVLPLKKSAFKRRLKRMKEKETLLSGVSWHSIHEPSGYLQVSSVEEGELPAGYFSETPEESVSYVLDFESQLASYRNKIYVIGNADDAAEQITLTGLVIEKETGLPLPGVSVHDEVTETYQHSDRDGRYEIRLPSGENTLHFMMDGKEESTLRVQLNGNGSLDVTLSDKINLIKEAVISASSMEQHRRTAIGVEKVSIGVVNKIPTVFGEGDLLKAVHTLPGVQSGGEASGGINVRGGSTGENLILFNGNTIYNPSHLFGIFSSFNPDIVDGVDLYKGTVPAEFGGRISSVMDVSSRSGDFSRFRGSLGIGVLTSRFHLEAPVWKEKTSVNLGGRTTYSDWILKKLPSSSYYNGASAGFSDANAIITHRFTQSDQLRLSGYFASDYFTLSDNMSIRYKNINASLQFQHKGDEGRMWQVGAGYDRYSNTTGDYSVSYAAYDLTTIINQVFLKPMLRLPFGKHRMTAGMDAVYYSLQPGEMEPHNLPLPEFDYGGIYDSGFTGGMGGSSFIVADALERESGLETSVFVSDNYSPVEALSLEGGLRLSSFLTNGKPSVGPELRFSAKYSPLPNLSFKGGFDMMRQYIHLISNTSGISPTDTWRLSNDRLDPSRGWQGSLGAYWSLVSAGLDFSAETYWKETSKALDYKAGATLSMNPNLPDDLVPVRGRAYGVELMVKKPAGRLTGWISYTWSRSRLREMLDRGSETIAAGRWYRAPQDRPHEVKVVANYALTHRFSFSTNVEYSSGRPITVPIGKYYYAHQWHMAYSERNAYRIPDYFRWDMAFNIDPGHYIKALVHYTLTVGVYNILGRKNAHSVFFRTLPTGEVKGYMLSVFATQVPYINLNILF